MKRLYFDGKTQIDQLTAQVEQLQNAIANQRMSQSRTSLDDSEYTTRFHRLNGAINNLAFNIRKDWTTLPPWLDKYVSADALKTGKQEMTAVGRAVISRWIVEEIFDRCFHPGLDPELSGQLKIIERNIRLFSYKMNSQEELDALTSKVVAWRMTTLEGLQAVLNSPESNQHRQDFTQRAATNLTANLYQHLTNPAPLGVDGSASMIVELAVGIAFHIPMESRDVAITYPLPLEDVVPHLMEVEKTGLPTIETRSADDSDSDGEGSGGKDEGPAGKDRRGMFLSSTYLLPFYRPLLTCLSQQPSRRKMPPRYGSRASCLSTCADDRCWSRHRSGHSDKDGLGICTWQNVLDTNTERAEVFSRFSSFRYIHPRAPFTREIQRRKQTRRGWVGKKKRELLFLQDTEAKKGFSGEEAGLDDIREGGVRWDMVGRRRTDN